MENVRSIRSIASSAARDLSARFGISRGEAEIKLAKMLQTIADHITEGEIMRFSAQASDGSVGMLIFSKCNGELILKRERPVKCQRKLRGSHQKLRRPHRS